MSINLKVATSVKDYIAQEGYDAKFGARPLRRAIQTKIEDALANEILEKKISAGDEVQVKLVKNEIVFTARIDKP